MRYSISRQPPGLCICSRGSRRCAPCCSAQIEPPKVLDQPATVSSAAKKYLYLETSGKPGIMSGKHYQSQKAIFLIKDGDLPKDVRVDSLQMIGNGWR